MMVSLSSKVQTICSQMYNSSNRSTRVSIIKINNRMTWFQIWRICTHQVAWTLETIDLQLLMPWTCKIIIKHNSNRICLCLCSNNPNNSSSRSSSPWLCNSNNSNKWCSKCKCSHNSSNNLCLEIWTIMECNSQHFSNHRVTHKETKCKTIQCKRLSLALRIVSNLTSRVLWKMIDKHSHWTRDLTLSRTQIQTTAVLILSNYTED